jgi:hypothetical protein
MQTKPATKEFIEWLRKNVGELIPMTKKVVESGEQHVPALFVFPKDDVISVQIMPMDPFFAAGTEGKDLVSMLHKQVGEDEQVECAVLVVEAYIVTATIKDQPISPVVDMKVSVADHPQRREAITFNAINHGMQLIATYIIKRPENTINDTWDHLMDPRVGILEGEGAGEGVTAAVGRMVLDDRNIH